MRLLIDTHTFLWFVGGKSELSSVANSLIKDVNNEIFLSTASVWEIAIKISIGKLTLTPSYKIYIKQQMTINLIQSLEITIDHTAAIINLPFHHRDPFDRLLVAQAMVEQMPIVSGDRVLDAYGIKRLW